MDNRTLVLFVIILAAMGAGFYFFWKNSKHETNKYDRGIAWANATASMTSSAGDTFSNIFGHKLT